MQVSGLLSLFSHSVFSKFKKNFQPPGDASESEFCGQNDSDSESESESLKPQSWLRQGYATMSERSLCTRIIVPYFAQ
jgi:hypothetical protein